MKLKNKDVIFVPLFIIGGKLTSFLFNALLGSYYGAGKISDAFIMAHSIPTILFEGVATALISCYIPIQRSLKYENPEKIDDFNSNMASISFLLSIIITVLYFSFRKQINPVYASGFDSDSLQLLNNYSTVLVWSIPFIGAYAIFRAHLQVSGRKSISSIGQITTYAFLIVAVVTCYPYDISLSVATLVGNVFCFVLFGVFAYKTGFRYRPYLSFKETYIKTLLIMIFPIFFSTLASELASIIDKYFASQYPDGIITSLSYGYQLSFAMQGIVSSSLLIVVFPSLADKAAAKDEHGMNKVVYICTDIVSWIVFPIVVGGIIISGPIINILFGHGNFTDESVRITASIFSGYMIGVLPMCIKHIGDRICFAMKKTNYAMITTFMTVGTNIILDYVMSKILGFMGLVYATGISIIIATTALFIMIRRTDRTISYKRITSSLMRPAVCSIFMGAIVFFISRWMTSGEYSDLVTVAISVFAGAFVYFGVAVLLFRKQLRTLIHAIKK